MLLYIILATLAVSLVSLVGFFILFINEKFCEKLIPFLVALSVGGLLGGALFHLIPGALIASSGTEDAFVGVFIFVVIGLGLFFLLEQFLGWHHSHDIHHCDSCDRVEPVAYLVLVGDALHNFIDGLVIAAAFVVSVPVGIATTLVVAVHEIPQEIGDFGVLIHSGIKKTRALALNLLSALVAVLGGLVGFFIIDSYASVVPFLLALASGGFLYIASSDLIPEIKHEKIQNLRKVLWYFLTATIGLVVMLLLRMVEL